MSVKPATDELRLISYKPNGKPWITLYASEHDSGVFAADLSRIHAAALSRLERIRALTTRAEEAEALLREALDYVQSSIDGTRARRDTIARIEAHLQEHADGE